MTCWFFHVWERWSAPFKGEYDMLYQRRACLLCGMVESRYVGQAKADGA